MREFPVTVSSHNVYHINSSASNLFDDDQYQRKLPTIESDINCSRFHQTSSTAQQQHQQQQHQQQQQPCNNNGSSKNAANYICTSNGDLTSLQSGRLQNFTNINNIRNNNCNRSHKIGAVKSSSNDKNVDRFNDARDGDGSVDMNRQTNPNGSYSIFDAITNAVTTGHCASAVYPAHERNDATAATVVDFDQINHSPDPLATSTSIHNLKNGATAAAASSHINSECGPFQHYNYHFGNSRPHQFPSTNYKHSYLLWIGTPVAARYPNYTQSNIRRKKIRFTHCFVLFARCFCMLINFYIFYSLAKRRNT